LIRNDALRQDGEYARMNLPQGQRHGLIAQDVEKVLPDLVKETAFELATAQARFCRFRYGSGTKGTNESESA
jgi:hypothetical protein